MHFQLKKTITHVSVLTALLPTLPALVSTAIAHERPGPAAQLDPARAPQRGTYAYDSPSGLVRSGVTRECVTTGMWTIDGAVPACHPEFFTGATAAPAASSASTGAAQSGGSASKAAAAAAVPVAAAAASGGKLDPAKAPQRGAYAYDSLTRNVRTAVTRECVKTGTWTPEGATPDCHPDLFAVPQSAAPAPAPAPQAAAPAPAPAPAPQAEAAPAAPVEAAAPPAEEVESVADFQPEGDDPNMLPIPAAEDAAVADDTISEPTMFYDEQQGVANADGVSEPKQFNDEPMATESAAPAVAAVVEEPAASDQPTDDAPARDDTATALKEEEQAGAQNDESAVATQDDGIVGRKEFGDDEAPMATQSEEPAPATADSGANDAAAAAPAEQPAQEQPEQEQPAQEPPAAEAPTQPAAEPAAAAPEPAQEAAPAAAQAEPTPPAPAEKPAAAEPKAVILPVTVTLGAEALFDFDRSKVRKGDSTKLDDLVGKLGGVNYDNILVVGHADRIGTKTYNQRLSERRAGAVKNYLANKGVDPKVIKTEGRGELEPTTDAATCKKVSKKKLIQCLQPDRRVEVTVTGKSDKK